MRHPAALLRLMISRAVRWVLAGYAAEIQGPQAAPAGDDWDLVSPGSPHLLTAAIFRAADPAQSSEAGSYVADLYRHNRQRDETLNLRLTQLVDEADFWKQRAEAMQRKLAEMTTELTRCEARARSAEKVMREQRRAIASLQTQVVNTLSATTDVASIVSRTAASTVRSSLTRDRLRPARTFRPDRGQQLDATSARSNRRFDQAPS